MKSSNCVFVFIHLAWLYGYCCKNKRETWPCWRKIVWYRLAFQTRKGERIGWYASRANELAGQLSCEKSRESHIGKETLRPAMIGELARPCSHATGQPFPFLNDTTQPKRTYQFSYYLFLIYILFGFSRRQRTNDYGFIERRVRLFSVFTLILQFWISLAESISLYVYWSDSTVFLSITVFLHFLYLFMRIP